MAGVKQEQESFFCVIKSENWIRSELQKKEQSRTKSAKNQNMHTSGPEPQYKNNKTTVAYSHSKFSSL